MFIFSLMVICNLFVQTFAMSEFRSWSIESQIKGIWLSMFFTFFFFFYLNDKSIPIFMFSGKSCVISNAPYPYLTKIRFYKHLITLTPLDVHICSRMVIVAQRQDFNIL